MSLSNSKRSEVTVATMGKVHNPEGDGVAPVSSAVTAARRKHAIKQEGITSSGIVPLAPEANNAKDNNHHHGVDGIPETVTKDEGSSRRNITRKHTPAEVAGVYDSTRKRHGGAGKGKWTQAMDGSDTLPITQLDVNDPLYDESEIDGAVLVSIDGGGEHTSATTTDKHYDPVAEKVVYGPMFTLPEFKIRMSDALREYFDSGDADEFVACISELKCSDYHSEIVKKSISLSLDKTSREKELVSRLLCVLHPSVLSDKDVKNGFEHLLEDMDDLAIDAPDAKTIVGTFVARSVVDEVLPPAFLSNRMGEVIENAVRLLSMEHCGTRLERAWGPGDGRPVEDIKVAMDQLLKEYLLSRELDEAARCIRELNCPHYHHELVKRGVTVAMEELHDKKDATSVQEELNSDDLDAMAALFMFLNENAIIQESQINKGLYRLHARLEDLKLDVSPKAPQLLQNFEGMLSSHGFKIDDKAVE